MKFSAEVIRANTKECTTVGDVKSRVNLQDAFRTGRGPESTGEADADEIPSSVLMRFHVALTESRSQGSGVRGQGQEAVFPDS